MSQKPAPKARSTTPSKAARQDVRPNSVNLKSQALETLLDKLDVPDDNAHSSAREFVRWLALPEMMHVGSLIVDDVQDKSVIRRGGPAAHLMYGEAQAINSGTAAYFLGNHLINSASLTDRNKVRILQQVRRQCGFAHRDNGKAAAFAPRSLPEAISTTGDDLASSMAMSFAILRPPPLRRALPYASIFFADISRQP